MLMPAVQADAVDKNQVSPAQLWVLLLGQVIFLVWVMVLRRVQVSPKTLSGSALRAEAPCSLNSCCIRSTKHRQYCSAVNSHNVACLMMHGCLKFAECKLPWS